MSETNLTRGRRNEVIGYVVSDKMDKTIKVMVYRSVKHKAYGKFLRRDTKYFAHDENNSAKIGDKVRIFETRPLSKNKRWQLSEIVEPAKK